MAQPPAYNREKNFTLNSGRETDHPALNAELDRASNSINDIRTNLAILQADDGKLRPSVVTADSISEELRVSLVEGVVMDAQAMLDRSLAAADASSASARVAKASEEKALESSSRALIAAEEAEESAKALSLAVNADWNATEGRAQILNRPELSAVAISGQYKDLDGKPGNLATTEDIAVLQEAFAEKGIPVGMVGFFAMSAPPPGYLMADGRAVGRETYPDLFAAIGTTFGEGDGETTFNLPDLIDRFAQGSNTPGQKIEAGLPNITGGVGLYNSNNLYGATRWHPGNYPGSGNSTSFGSEGGAGYVEIDARGSNPIYGSSDTVQPPALTLLPCIKAFDAAVNPGLVDMTGLANDVAGLSGLPTDMAALSANKLDKSAAFTQDQTWQTPSRVAGTIYTNTTGRAITVSASHSQNGSWSEIKGYVNGVVISTTGGYYTTVSSGSITFIVPNGSTYTVTGNVTAWRELR